MSKYPATGPWNNGASPGISATVMTNIEQYLGYAADSNITADGNGNLTLVKVLLTHGSISRISSFGGTGSVTNASHGLGVTPDLVIVNYAGNFGSPPSNPAYYYGSTSTTVNVVGQGGYSWLALAIKF